MRCSNCDTRRDGPPFWYADRPWCCECMSALCSWFLDGGTVTDPDLFDVGPDEPYCHCSAKIVPHRHLGAPRP